MTFWQADAKFLTPLNGFACRNILKLVSRQVKSIVSFAEFYLFHYQG
jgi:hypothetical protein